MTLAEFRRHVRPNERQRLSYIQGKKDKKFRRCIPYKKVQKSPQHVHVSLEVSPGVWTQQIVNHSYIVQR